MSDKVMPVQWPAKAFDLDARDLGTPIVNLIERLRNIDSPGPEKDDGDNGKVTGRKGTPYSLQVISAGATSLAKWTSGLVGGVGGLGVITGAVAVVLNSQHPSVQATIVGGTALVAAAVCIAVAIIVRGDVMARSTASAARKQATSNVVGAVLSAYRYEGIPRDPVPPVYSPRYVITTGKAGGWKQVETFAWDEEHDRFIARLASGDAVPVKEISAMIDLGSFPQSLAPTAVIGNGQAPRSNGT